MKVTHDYAARIDYDLWMDCLKVKELDGGTTSINALVNEGLKLVRDRKMQEITAQRKQRLAFTDAELSAMRKKDTQ